MVVARGLRNRGNVISGHPSYQDTIYPDLVPLVAGNSLTPAYIGLVSKQDTTGFTIEVSGELGTNSRG